MKKNGTEVMDVGQGRGGECQYLSALVMTDPSAWKKDGSIVRIDYHKVDILRGKVADWLEDFGDQRLSSGVSLRESVVSGMRGSQTAERKWQEYLRGVRDARRKQWGDENTLLALSGVLGRTFWVISAGRDKDQRAYCNSQEVSVPAHWGAPEPSRVLPVVVTHTSENHFCPVRVDPNGELQWMLESEVDPRLLRRSRKKRRKWREKDREEVLGDWNEVTALDSPCLARNFPSAQRPEEHNSSLPILIRGEVEESWARRRVEEWIGTCSAALAVGSPSFFSSSSDLSSFLSFFSSSFSFSLFFFLLLSFLLPPFPL